MRTSRIKRATPLIGAAVALILLAVAGDRLRAQIPNWPQWQTDPNSACQGPGTTCAVCGVGVVVGCTSGIPANWQIGNCAQIQGPGCTVSMFNCGPQYNCVSGIPTQIPCPGPTSICQ